MTHNAQRFKTKVCTQDDKAGGTGKEILEERIGKVNTIGSLIAQGWYLG